MSAIEFDGDGGFMMAVGSTGGKVCCFAILFASSGRAYEHLFNHSVGFFF